MQESKSMDMEFQQHWQELFCYHLSIIRQENGFNLILILWRGPFRLIFLVCVLALLTTSNVRWLPNVMFFFFKKKLQLFARSYENAAKQAYPYRKSQF